MAWRFSQKRTFGIFIIFIFIFFGSFLIYKNTKMPKIPQNFTQVEFKTEKNEVLIGIISDTHIPNRVKVLPKEIREIFKDVDLIIHSGDIENLETLKELEKIAPVFAVEGNMDLPEVRKELPEGILLKIYEWKIGIIHSPFPFWLGSHFNQIQEKVAEKLAKKEGFDVLIFGHTHQSFLKELNHGGKKFLLINPGSPTVPPPFSQKTSIAILKIKKDSFKGEIISF